MNGYLSPLYAESLVEFGAPLHLPRCDGWLLVRPIPQSDDCDAIVPESWKMTPREQRCVDEAWQAIERGGKVQILKQFLQARQADSEGTPK